MSGKPMSPPDPILDPKPPAPPKPAAAPAPPKPMPKELRQEYERVKGELDTRNKAVAEMEAKIADFERRGKDTELLQQRLQTLEKTVEEKEAQLRTYAYEKDPAFVEKYDKPFDDQLAYTRQVVSQLQVEENGQVRPATFEDFAELYKMPYAKAVATANEKFGQAGQIVLNHMSELQRIEFNRGKALNEARERIAKNAKADEAEAMARQTNIKIAWEKLNKDLSETNEDYRSPANDKELEELRNEGYRLFDGKASTPEQRMIKNAHIRQRVAAFAPNQVTIKRLKSEVDRLRAENDALKNPEPGRTQRPGGNAPAGDGTTWEQGLLNEAAKLGSPTR